MQQPRGGAWLAPYLQGMDGTWRPLRVSAYQAAAALLGPRQAAGYHALNLVLHATCGWMVLLLALRRLGDPRAALVAGAIFLLHPLQVESVAWISGLKEPLSAALGLAALWLLDAANPRVAPGRRALGTLALLAAVLAREGAAAILGVAALEGWLLGDGEARRRLLRRLAPAALGVLALGVLYLRLSACEAVRGAAWDGGAGERLASMLPLWGRALRLLPLPLGLSSHVEDLIGPGRITALRLAGGAATLLLAGALLLGRGRLAAWLALSGALCYLPASNLLIPLRVPFAEHYLYLGLAFAATGAGSLLARHPRRAWLLAALWAALGAARLPVWSGEIPHWAEAHRRNPATARLELNLAAALGEAGWILPCARHLDRAEPRLASDGERLDAAFNRGLLAERAGDRAGADAAFLRAAALARRAGRADDAARLEARARGLSGPAPP